MKKIIVLIITCLLVTVLFTACEDSSPEGRINKLKEIDKELSENSTKGSAALSTDNKSMLESCIVKSNELKKDKDNVMEEIKRMESKLSSSQKKEAEELGVEF